MRTALALALLAACSTPTPPAIGVATWNLEMFPRPSTVTSEVARHIDELGLDVLAVEEIEDESALADIAAQLAASYYLVPIADAGTGPRLGLVWRGESAEILGAETRFVGDAAFPRPAVRSTLRWGDEQAIVWVVHLKAGTGTDDEELRRQAVASLEAAVRADLALDDQVLVLGDFNEAAGDARADEVFAPFQAPEYDLVTWPLAESGVVTYLPAGIMLDHVVATSALAIGTPEVPRLDVDADYTAEVSDHLPVIVHIEP